MAKHRSRYLITKKMSPYFNIY